MQKTMTAQLEALAKLRHEPQKEVFAKAMELGVTRLYRESILALYLKKKLSRRRAVKAVGFAAVEMADEQHAAIQEDVIWGLSA